MDMTHLTTWITQAQNGWEVAAKIMLALPALLTALIAFFAVIPGEQPEKFLYGMVDWLGGIVQWIESISRK